MKQLIFISVLFFFTFSCQKERLKDEKEIFIGEWELKYTIKSEWVNAPGSPREIDIIYPSGSATTLDFKKNGKVFLNINGEEIKYKMNLKRDGAYLHSELKDIYIESDSGNVFFIEKQYYFRANFHNGLGAGNKTQVIGSIGKDWMRIRSSSDIIEEYVSFDSRQTRYYNFFKRVG